MKLKVQGHRGARGRYPENTLLGFEYALSLDVDAIEMDICFTKDKTPIVFHDQVFNGQNICDLTIDEVQKIVYAITGINFPLFYIPLFLKISSSIFIVVGLYFLSIQAIPIKTLISEIFYLIVFAVIFKSSSFV